MNDMHPDIVLGQPIPEIEPRVDEELSALMMRANRWGRWFWLLLIVLVTLFSYFRVGWWITIPSGIMLIILWVYSIKELGKLWKEKQKSGEIGAGVCWGVPIRVNIEYLLYTASFVMVFFFIFDSGRDGFSGIFRNLGALLLMSGGGSIYLGRKARQPGQICCKRCEYPLAGLSLPNPCPECGEVVMGEAHTTDRPRVRSRWFLWGGLGALVLGLFVMYASIFQPGFMYGPVPRGVLLKMASSDRGAFDRLMLSPLSEDEEQQLIDAMVANKTTSSFNSSSNQDQWLANQIFTSRLSDDQLDSMLMETTEIKIDAPSSGRAGEPIRLGLTADYVRLPFSIVMYFQYYFNGFAIDDEMTPKGGSNQPRSRLYLTNDEYRSRSEYIWTPLAPGRHTIRARIVLALFPNGGAAANIPIDWSQPEDSMFGMTPIWSHVVDLEETIEVKP